MKVSLLGRLYEIKEETPSTDARLKNADGYCDSSIGVCVIDKMDSVEENSLKYLSAFKQKVIWHELIHAFLTESGLREQCNWATGQQRKWWTGLQRSFLKYLLRFKKSDAYEYRPTRAVFEGRKPIITRNKDPAVDKEE